MPESKELLTKEYLLKIAPDISVFEVFDKYNAESNIYYYPAYMSSITGDNTNFKRAIYRFDFQESDINPSTVEVTSNNSFFYKFVVDNFLYVIAICTVFDEYIDLQLLNVNNIRKNVVGF